MADCGKHCALSIGLGLDPHEGFEIVFLRQAAEKLCGHVRASMAVRVDNKKSISAGCSKRLSGKASAREEARSTLRYVELLSDARTPLADFFSILRTTCAKNQRQKLKQPGAW